MSTSPLKHKEGRHMMLTEEAHAAEHKKDVPKEKVPNTNIFTPNSALL